MKKQSFFAIGLLILIGIVSSSVAFGQAKKAPKGAINGLFTINKNGDQVYFSQGNLQYIGSASKPYWKFADHQWDYIGRQQNGDSQNIDRDLFGWGTSGIDHGAVCYQPWSIDYTSTNYLPYGDNYHLYGKDGTADWGANPISNGGNKAKTWRTLSINELEYVLSYRDTPSSIRFVKAQVNGVNGIIILPDNWSRITYILQNKNDKRASYEGNIISLEDWMNIEKNGAVFLPAAGYRHWKAVGNDGSYGYYWTSNCGFEKNEAYSIRFENSAIYYGGREEKNNGLSVRLVCPAQ